jgi:anti-sigma factor RsiW
MQTEHLELYALGALPEELSKAVESHLKTCVDCGVRFEESRKTMGDWQPGYSGPEKRRHLRVATDDPAALTVLQLEPAPRLKTRILDASKQGLRLLVPHDLMRGAVIQIHVRDLFILAEVRHCRAVGQAFHAGVQIQDVFPAVG